MKKSMVAMAAWGAACLCQATVISVVADAEIRSDAPDTNYGAETTLSALSTSTPTYRKGYIKFDASGLGAGTTVSDITSFSMYFTQTYARDSKFYLITGATADSWNESTITWNNAPANGSGTTCLNDASFTSTRVGLSGTEAAPGVVEFVWDSAALKQSVIDELNNDDRVVTLACMRDSTSRLATFASKENSSGHPVIQMDLQTIPEPASLGLMVGVVVGGLALRRFASI